MSAAPITVKLSCRSWQQLAAIHKRDLNRSSFFLKSKKPPPIGRVVHIHLVLPSGSAIALEGSISAHIAEGEMDGRGPGIDIALNALPSSVMWLIESALTSAGLLPISLGGGFDSSVPKSSADRPEGQQPRPLPPLPDDIPINEGPALDEGEEWANAEADLVKALWQELSSMAKLNPFQLLDLPYEIDDASVRRAFGELSKRYHPDRFTRYDSFEIRELANEVFLLLRDAYRKIGTQAGRAKLLQSMPSVPSAAGAKASASHQAPALPSKPAASPKPAAPRIAPPPIPAKPAAAAIATPPPTPEAPTPKAAPKSEAPSLPVAKTPQATDVPTNQRNPLTNSASLPIQFEAEKSDQSDRVALGLNVLESGQYEQALRILRVEVRKEPGNIRALAGVELAEGRLALAAGDRLEAAQRFEAALDIDPSNERAAREIAEMRRQATSQRKGLLSKLMNKG